MSDGIGRDQRMAAVLVFKSKCYLRYRGIFSRCSRLTEEEFFATQRGTKGYREKHGDVGSGEVDRPPSTCCDQPNGPLGITQNAPRRIKAGGMSSLVG